MKQPHIFLLSLLLWTAGAFAQDSSRYTDGRDLMIIGKGLPTNPVWVRWDSTLSAPMTPAVKSLARHSAGIAVLFETNSTYIRLKWSVAQRKFYNNITPIAHSGLDLYAMHNGRWQFVNTARPGDKETSFNYPVVNNMDGANRQYMVYLPIYNELTSLEIGVAPQATIAKPAKPGIDTTKRIVIYGSSILQGASASRAGMTYPSILSRHTGWEMVNLGFSGNGKMELPVAELMATMPASVFVLDCIPNPTPQEVRERAYPFIKHLLTTRPEVPVLLIETSNRETGFFDKRIGDVVKEKNKIIREVYTKLKKEGYKQLHYLSGEDLIGHDHEGTIDGTHNTDIGFLRQAGVILPVLKKLMK